MRNSNVRLNSCAASTSLRASACRPSALAKGIEEYVEGKVESNDQGEFFVARQALPFGRPYGKLRIGDISGADLSALELFLGGTHLPEMSRLVCLDTETTGLAGGTGTCAFLIGIGAPRRRAVCGPAVFPARLPGGKGHPRRAGGGARSLRRRHHFQRQDV